MVEAILQLHSRDAEKVRNFMKNSDTGPSKTTKHYLREARLSKGVRVDVGGDCSDDGVKRDETFQQLEKKFGEDVSLMSLLRSKSPWEWLAELEGHALPTWWKATLAYPNLNFPPSTSPLFGDEQGCIPLKEDVLALLENDKMPVVPKSGCCFLQGVFS